jgi:hypothetical protein
MARMNTDQASFDEERKDWAMSCIFAPISSR